MCRSPNSSANPGLADGTRSVPATFVGHVKSSLAARLRLVPRNGCLVEVSLHEGWALKRRRVLVNAAPTTPRLAEGNERKCRIPRGRSWCQQHRSA